MCQKARTFCFTIGTIIDKQRDRHKQDNDQSQRERSSYQGESPHPTGANRTRPKQDMVKRKVISDLLAKLYDPLSLKSGALGKRLLAIDHYHTLLIRTVLIKTYLFFDFGFATVGSTPSRSCDCFSQRKTSESEQKIK